MIGHSMRRLAVVCISCSLTAIPSLAAAEPPSNVLVTSAEWHRLQEAMPGQCGMEVPITGASHLKFTIGAAPGQDLAVMSVVGDGPNVGATDRPMEVQLVISPSGERFASSMIRTFNPVTHETYLSFSELPQAFLESLGAGNFLNIEWDSQAHLQIRYSDVRSAVAELAQCQRRLLREWGLNAEFIESLKQNPRPAKDVQVFTPDDYPMSALRNEEQGTAVIRFTVGLDGRAKNCTIVRSSGSKSLDKQSCRSVVARARYLPALDQSGKAVAVDVAQAVRWALM